MTNDYSRLIETNESLQSKIDDLEESCREKDSKIEQLEGELERALNGWQKAIADLTNAAERMSRLNKSLLELQSMVEKL